MNSKREAKKILKAYGKLLIKNESNTWILSPKRKPRFFGKSVIDV